MIFYYLIYLLILIILLPKYEKVIYLLFWKHLPFFMWYLFYGSSPILFKFNSSIGYICLLLFYPLLAKLYPRLEFSKHISVMYLNLPALEHDQKLVKKMHSKIFWFKIFSKFKIKTPNVICFYDGKKNYFYKRPENNVKYISKPNLGSNGNNVTLKTFNEYLNKIKYTDEEYILQDYVIDCFKKNRALRIITKSINGNFEIDTTSNHFSNNINSNSIIKTSQICKSKNCDFLSSEENRMIDIISEKLLKLHKGQFDFVPYIGWDVILSCDGPYVLEGNVAPALFGVRRSKFTNDMISIYNKMSYSF